MSQKYFVFWNSDDHTKLQSWWKSLQENRGWRAEMRRAKTPADILLCQGFKYLYYKLAGYWTVDKNLLGLAAAAGVIAHIEGDDGRSFAHACATPAEGSEKAALSELRFSQLQKSRSLDELFVRMIRAVHLLHNKASVVSVADTILHWAKEMVDGDVDEDPRNRILVRWGLDYFQNLPQKGNK
jgi:CRISPR system Cascade subunit CasB